MLLPRRHNRDNLFFCSESCKDKFTANPADYLDKKLLTGAEAFYEKTLLHFTASIEMGSEHPLAAAVAAGVLNPITGILL